LAHTRQNGKPFGFDYLDFGQIVVAYLRDSGNSRDMAVDASAGIQYAYTPPNGFDTLIFRLAGHIVDNQQMNADGFGGGAALSSGCRLILNGPDGNETRDLLDNTTIQTNGDFDTFFTTNALLSSRGLGFQWASSAPVVLPRLRNGTAIVWENQDSLTGLEHFEIALHGMLVETSFDD